MKRYAPRWPGMDENEAGLWVKREEVRELEAENKRLRERMDTILKCLDGGLQGENRLRNMQLLDEVKAIAKGGGKDGQSK